MSRARRWLAGPLLTLVAALAAVGAVPSPGVAAAQGTTSTLTIPAQADAQVREDYPTRAYGRQADLRSDASPVALSYLRFDTSAVTAPVTRVELRILAASTSHSGVRAHTASGSWDEAAVTWATRPSIGPATTGSGPTTGGQWVTVDVTALFQPGRPLEIALSGESTTSVTLRSRESGATTAPQLVVTTSATGTPNPNPQPQPPSAVLPLRAAFYYPWYSNAWQQSGFFPYTHYRPSLGFYDITEQVVREHIAAMQYGHIGAGIASWWGQGHHTDAKMPVLLRAAAGTGFRWSTYYEAESLRDPSVEQIRSDLTYLRDRYAADPSYLRIDGRFVVFVYADGADGCDMARRWKEANDVGAYVVLKVFSGYRTCGWQPDGWHQYGPAGADASQAPYSYTVSPGFWHAREATPRLARDLARWRESVTRMNASGAQWQLITTFNEWGEGTSVESAAEWASASGRGAYLDVLHALPPAATSTPPTTTPPVSAAPILGAAGDIACDPASGSYNGGLGTSSSCQQRATSDLLLGAEVTAVAALGDNQYENGTLQAFQTSYDSSWGRLKSKTKPVPGNHEYHTSGASGYYSYFGAAAGDPATGWYSYDVGEWHVVALNSNCDDVGGCQVGSAQERWLRADLAASTRACTVAYWHHPMYSSGYHGNNPDVAPLYQALYDAGVEVLLSGHDHEYERFAPQDAAGQADPSRGVRQFVVGTGGKSLRPFETPRPNSEVRDSQAHGVLKLTLRSGGFDWQFVQAGTRAVRDSGSGTCH